MTSDEYLLDNRAAAAERRFGALSALFDDVTFRHVEALGIQRGWRCWEVGAGGPSVPNWLADRVGPDGHVLTTDIDTSWIDAVAPHVEVRRHGLNVTNKRTDLQLSLSPISERAEATGTATSPGASKRRVNWREDDRSDLRQLSQ